MSLALASHWTLILSYLINLFNSLYLTHINKTLAKTLLCGYLGVHCYNHMVLLRCIFSSVYRIIFSKLKGFLAITLSSNLIKYTRKRKPRSLNVFPNHTTCIGLKEKSMPMFTWTGQLDWVNWSVLTNNCSFSLYKYTNTKILVTHFLSTFL